jgi:hypothetical protein
LVVRCGAPFVQGALGHVDQVLIRGVHVRESRADAVVLGSTRGARVRDRLLKAPDLRDALLEHAPDHVVGNAIVVAAIGLSADALDGSLLLQESHVDAHARLADAQLVGQLIEAAGLRRDEQHAEQPSGDARHALGLEEDGDVLDEIVRGGVGPAGGHS